VKDAGDAAVI